MGISSRRKGKSAELQAAKLLRLIVPELAFRRTAQVTMMQGVPDLQLHPDYGDPNRLWIEVKSRSGKLWPHELKQALERSVKNCSSECRLIVLIYKRDRVGWHFYVASPTSTQLNPCTMEELRDKILEALK